MDAIKYLQSNSNQSSMTASHTLYDIPMFIGLSYYTDKDSWIFHFLYNLWDYE